MYQLSRFSRSTSIRLCSSWNRSTRKSSFRTESHTAIRASINLKAIVICVVPIALGYLSYSSHDRNEHSNRPAKRSKVAIHWPDSVNELNGDKVSSTKADLMSTIPNEQLQPGRPETLTREEEGKLKEFWSATLRVFGVSAAGTNAQTLDENSNDTEASATESQDVSEKKPKKGKFGSLLSRNKKGKDDRSPRSSSPTTSPPDIITKFDEKDDKYGLAKEFKAALAGQTPAELRAAFWSMVKHDNPDGLLLRFLRARKWDIEKALIMMVSTMHWRANEMKVHEIIQRGELGAIADSDNDFMKQLRMGKSFLHGWDKDGRPICHVRVRLHKAGDQSEGSLERYTIYIMETARLLLVPPVDTACIVFDMTGFAMANMDYPPVKFMIKCFEAHYPESLGICLVHKAPWIFQGIWAIIRGWLDPVVASKIHFTKTLEDLEEFIPESNIIKELGGPEDWEYKFIEPSPDEDATILDKDTLLKLESERDETIKQYEDLTKTWIDELPVKDNGNSPKAPISAIKNQRFELAKKLRDQYWVMDKYIRGRTFYDRTGVIGPGGSIDFYGKRNGASKDKPTSEEDVD